MEYTTARRHNTTAYRPSDIRPYVRIHTRMYDAVCSRLKNLRFWRACSPASGDRSDSTEPRSTMRSLPETSSSSVRKPARTGRPACSWWARFARTAASAVVSCVRTVRDAGRLGIRTSRLKSCASGIRHLSSQVAISGDERIVRHARLRVWSANPSTQKRVDERKKWDDYPLGVVTSQATDLTVLCRVCRSP